MFHAHFKDTEEIFALFVRASMFGELLPVARLVERAFGKGAYRRLGKAWA